MTAGGYAQLLPNCDGAAELRHHAADPSTQLTDEEKKQRQDLIDLIRVEESLSALA